MMNFRKLNIKSKLIVVVLLTSTIGLLFTGFGVLTLDRIKQKEILAEELSILARVIASRSAAALSFRDQIRAKDNLSSLLVRESVVVACMSMCYECRISKLRGRRKLGLYAYNGRRSGVGYCSF